MMSLCRTHCELFPNSRHYDQNTVNEVRGVLLHATTGSCNCSQIAHGIYLSFLDTLTSMTSTALWTAEHNQSLLAILNHVKGML